MNKKNTLKANILDFKLASHSEILSLLGLRLKQQRILKQLKQSELAPMAGLSLGTIKSIENRGQASFEALIKVAIALDLQDDFRNLFELKIQSIEQLEKIEYLQKTKIPKRVRK